VEEAAKKLGRPSGCPFGDGKFNPHGSRLPAADLGPDPKAPEGAPAHIREAPTIQAVRNTFERMGFNDKETVALIVLGHQFGRCHPEVSGFEHPWYAFDPAHWNVYKHGLGYISAYVLGVARGMYRFVTTKAGKRQYQTDMFGGEPFMMLISDMALMWDKDYRQHLEYYDRNRKAFWTDSVAAWVKLTELGCDGLLTPERR